MYLQWSNGTVSIITFSLSISFENEFLAALNSNFPESQDFVPLKKNKKTKKPKTNKTPKQSVKQKNPYKTTKPKPKHRKETSSWLLFQFLSVIETTIKKILKILNRKFPLRTGRLSSKEYFRERL